MRVPLATLQQKNDGTPQGRYANHYYSAPVCCARSAHRGPARGSGPPGSQAGGPVFSLSSGHFNHELGVEIWLNVDEPYACIKSKSQYFAPRQVTACTPLREFFLFPCRPHDSK
eukprot:9293210-Pyramimonas_sp.AAC.1